MDSPTIPHMTLNVFSLRGQSTIGKKDTAMGESGAETAYGAGDLLEIVRYCMAKLEDDAA